MKYYLTSLIQRIRDNLDGEMHLNVNAYQVQYGEYSFSFASCHHMITSHLFYVQHAWSLMKLEFSQAERIQTLENKVKFLEEGNLLVKEQHSHPEVIQEEKEKCSEPVTFEKVIPGAHSFRERT